MLQPYAGKDLLPGPGIALVLRNDSPRDPWAHLGWSLGQYMKQVTDERLDNLYRNLFAAGWANPRPLPHSTRHADHEIRYLVMNAVSYEIIERREGRIPSVK